MTQTEQIAMLVRQVELLQATIVTPDDVYATMGIFTGFILAVMFVWMKQLKSIVCTNKDDMRSMFKGLLEAHLSNAMEQIRNMDEQIKYLRARYNTHMDKYHSRGE